MELLDAFGGVLAVQQIECEIVGDIDTLAPYMHEKQSERFVLNGAIDPRAPFSVRFTRV